ncbi:hypothetical protein [Marinicella sp. W31]|uniref:hypothetical protein n=1 Tax=Marinicella sp. W31 TaxID=3023713 RepID=UPI003757F415
MQMKKWMLWCGLMMLNSLVMAQSESEEEVPPAVIPGTEIFVATLNINGDEVKVGEPVNISQSVGYDSQPSFDVDDNIYYANFFGTRTNIWVYDAVSKKRNVYQNTAESEYSPTPLKNKPGISVVRVELTGDQHIYVLNDKKSERFSDLKQIGYHAWHGELLWTFVLSDAIGGGDLYATMPGQEAVKVYTNIGRTLTVDESTGYLYFIDKNTQPWQIKRIHGIQEQPKYVMDLPEGVEDFARDTQDRFWLGQGNRLFTNAEDGRWKPVAEFKISGYNGISRVALNQSANKVAFVLNETE